MWNIRGNFKHHISNVDLELSKHPEFPATPLKEADLGLYSKGRNFIHGWRFSIQFTDGISREIDILVNAHFPLSAVRVALANWKKDVMWPHIEYDGILCLFPDLHTYEVDNPTNIVLGNLNKAVSLIEDLIEGTIVEEVFKGEFLTYWMYDVTDTRKNVVTLFEPTNQSRILRCVNLNEKIYVAESTDELLVWIRNRFGKKIETKISKTINKCGLIWLDSAPLPNQYPQTGSDVLNLATKQGENAAQVAKEVSHQNSDDLNFLLGAEGKGGPGLMPVCIERPTIKGFRKEKIPDIVNERNVFGYNKVKRTQVLRADSSWIHGRGRDDRSTAISQKSVTVFGCGSVGSFLAENLARIGIRKLNIVDYEKLEWANIGRHALGASSIEKSKSLELADRLTREMPHLKIKGFDNYGQNFILSQNEEVLNVDLIVSVTGNWVFEYLLNEWHISQGRKRPIVYGWVESHAISGSAVVVSEKDGCFACGLTPVGAPIVPVVEWQDNQEMLNEPSCNDRFQPYSSVELMYITSMISETILYELLHPSEQSSRKIWVPSKRKLEEFDGSLNPKILKELGKIPLIAQQLELPWTQKQDCICNSATNSAF